MRSNKGKSKKNKHTWLLDKKYKYMIELLIFETNFFIIKQTDEREPINTETNEL